MILWGVFLSFLISVQAAEFEVCNGDNDYLEPYFKDVLPLGDAGSCGPQYREDELSKLKRLGSELQRNSRGGVSEDLSRDCIQLSMNRAPKKTQKNGSQYGYCPLVSNKGEIPKWQTKANRPCLSEPYANRVHDAFLASARCLDLPLREVFALYNHESYFQWNIRSSTGSTGFGQLTSIAIADVNLRGKLKDYESKPQCQGVKAAIESGIPSKKTSGGSWLTYYCQRIIGPGQPEANMIYGMAFYNIMRREAKRFLDLEATAQFIDPKIKDQLLIEVTRTMYNGGGGMGRTKPVGVLAELQSFLEVSKQKFSSIEEFRVKFSEYLSKNYDSKDPRRRKEVGEYALKVEADAKDLEDKKGGKACFN